MDVFELRNQLVSDYANYVRSFINISDERIQELVDRELTQGLLWPDPLIQINPSFEPGQTVEELVGNGMLHQECAKIFRKKPAPDKDEGTLRLHRHQSDAIKAARIGGNYVLTTGTGSGKSLAYIIPIVDHVLRSRGGKGIKAIVVYPMNALANSQENELQKFLCHGYPDQKGPVTFARYTGQENDEQKQAIIANPPDILLTNYVMMELILTRPHERELIKAGRGLRFLVLDELHTYRGRQGADVSLLVRRVREAFSADTLQCVGTSATLAGPGTYDEQRAEVARVSTLIFGAEVKPENVIGETLRRATPDADITDQAFISKLRQRLEAPQGSAPDTYGAFVQDPLSIWIESTLGLKKEPGTERLLRMQPLSITGEEGASRKLGELTGVDESRCENTLRNHLLANYIWGKNPDTGFPLFAFRLHQFISRGDTIYASLESEPERHLTVHGQQYVPRESQANGRRRILLPMVFCRECGQEYYCVRSVKNPETNKRQFQPRELSDRLSADEDDAGFLYLSSSAPWPTDPAEVIKRLPDDWIEQGSSGARVRSNRKKDLPKAVRVNPTGFEAAEGLDLHYLPAPFRFCLRCGVSYGPRQRSDFPKLASLATEGRSTATTVLSLGTIRYLRKDSDLQPQARKLLSFTDNRQDASLQAGHFNDFVQIGLLRSAIYRAVTAAGKTGIRHEDLVQRVEEALDLPLEMYASDPEVLYMALDDTRRALRSVLSYRIYRDLMRGWRITAPNLEQSGLLSIEYLSLPDVCKDPVAWSSAHPALAKAKPETRMQIATVLLDYMRRELAIKVDCLNPDHHERIEQQSQQRLIEPWALDDNELGKMQRAAVLFPRARRKNRDFGGDLFLSPRGGFGQYLRRPQTFPDHTTHLTLEETEVICRQLLNGLKRAGLVQVVSKPKDSDDVPGYQIPAAAFLWKAGEGKEAFHDPIRVPRPSRHGSRTNPFFINYYREIATEGKGLEAREHTAQVPYELRLNREDRFKIASLPLLYCSPTMELGVDIAELNTVNMRNIPPTPANYAQRSGRAGRSGQPALVFSYCSTFSSHDQYFFKRPGLMVAGAVTPPRLDLANEDLIRAHVQAIWLAESGLYLGESLTEILNAEGEDPDLKLKAHVIDTLRDSAVKERALARARDVLSSIQTELLAVDWYSDHWLEEVLTQIEPRFENSCERWRGLYRAAAQQRVTQHRIITDASRSMDDKQKAKRLRAEAEAQIALLIEVQRVVEADFYSYRYFASEGFLPGYSFPRLPLSAFIPARRQKKGKSDFLSRPRFLAISEFGPRAIVYHEGARYRINRVILPVGEQSDQNELVTQSAKQCDKCGYFHPILGGAGPDLCERCGQSLPHALTNLFRLQNVATRRTDKINSDEEERLRLGYEVKSGIRFAGKNGKLSCRQAEVFSKEKNLITIFYGPTATLWRLNMGWTRRANKNQLGFLLDIEKGYWAKNQQDTEDDVDDPASSQKLRVIPYVEDRRNTLLIKPYNELPDGVMASLQAALKNAIQVEYELEEMELAAEPLPRRDDRRLLLFYEAAEGGAGVLRHLIDDASALQRVARRALDICHFDPSSGEDLRRAPRAREDCEAACYDCLMSYTNQMDHTLLDRQIIRKILIDLSNAEVRASSGPQPRAELLEQLKRQAGSNLERRWLDHLEGKQLRLPSSAQRFFAPCKTRPDFLYDSSQTAIYVDGPPHDYPERQKRDERHTECMEDRGYVVIRFKHYDDWDAIIARYPNLFGKT